MLFVLYFNQELSSFNIYLLTDWLQLLTYFRIQK